MIVEHSHIFFLSRIRFDCPNLDCVSDNFSIEDLFVMNEDSYRIMPSNTSSRIDVKNEHDHQQVASNEHAKGANEDNLKLEKQQDSRKGKLSNHGSFTDPVFSRLMRRGQFHTSELVIARSSPLAGVTEFSNSLRRQYPKECENIFNGFLVEDYFDSQHVIQYSEEFLKGVLYNLAHPNNMRVVTFSHLWASLNENFITKYGFPILSDVELSDTEALLKAVDQLFTPADIATYGKIFLMHVINHLIWARKVLEECAIKPKSGDHLTTAQTTAQAAVKKPAITENCQPAQMIDNRKENTAAADEDDQLIVVKQRQHRQWDRSQPGYARE